MYYRSIFFVIFFFFQSLMAMEDYSSSKKIEETELPDKEYYLDFTRYKKINSHSSLPIKSTFPPTFWQPAPLKNNTPEILNFAVSPDKTKGVYVTREIICAYHNTTDTPVAHGFCLCQTSEDIPIKPKDHPMCWISNTVVLYGRCKDLYRYTIYDGEEIPLDYPIKMHTLRDNISALVHLPKKRATLVGFEKTIIITKENTTTHEASWNTSEAIRHVTCSPNEELIAVTTEDSSNRININIYDTQGNHLKKLSSSSVDWTCYHIANLQELILTGAEIKKTPSRNWIIVQDKNDKTLFQWEWNSPIEHIEYLPDQSKLAITDLAITDQSDVYTIARIKLKHQTPPL